MKEATGELNTTVITIVAIGAVSTFFILVILPRMKGSIIGSTQCSSAVGCTECANNKKTCSGYYNQQGSYEATSITCNCNE